MYSPTIQKLIDLFSKFPTVGPRTAARFVFYLTRLPKEKVDELLKAIEELKTKIKICPLCFNSFEGEGEKDICSICQDPRRDKTILCLVEKEVDLEAIEKTGKFKGLYFVLGGTISGLEKEKEKERIEERVEKLENRIKENSEIKELILALNPTTEGQSTTLWLQRKLKNLGIKITQLGRGLPVGGELEYADEETLSSALESRK
jgi:recombination protein RecR